jgi:tRNA(Arg) A34 adenosine deaminase TadA
MKDMQPKEVFMLKAIEVAISWFESWEYAIWAVIVKDNEIIAIWEVRRKRDEDPTAHAEIVAIRDACKKLNSRSLRGCILYSTQECCPMCTAAIIRAKMDWIVFWAFSQDTLWKWTDKFSWRQINISCKEILHKSTPQIEVVEWFMREKCKKLIIL